MKDDPRLNFQGDLNLNDNSQGLLKRVACYNHPMPISMVLLNIKENEIYICVICGSLEQKESTLFVYKALKKAENMGFPSFVGHVSIALPIYKDAYGRDIAVDSSRLQFTPDAQCLVLLNSIKTPFCREGKLYCSCPRCTSEFSEKNAVKIVQVKTGYVTIETLLRTTQVHRKRKATYRHLTVCFLVSVELKRIPKSTILVVGHNGFGEFGLWDIDKRILVSKFSAPGTSVFQCVPVGMFTWQSKVEHNTKELIDEIMNATKMWFSVMGENHILPVQNTDMAVWLLISTHSDPDSHSCQSSGKRQANLARCWRLALLVKNMVIMGRTLDSGVAAVASVGHGIIGRCDGLVYTWDLSTGNKLENLHHFKGTGVSCISTDNTSGALAVASEGELLVYVQS
ncbi:DNA binding [Forsythia ovata]|uniref:DNA binding n=1 Tax=Forsythia ovata TaxID=205694 RepID=A0ABD1WAB6_9LAMI